MEIRFDGRTSGLLAKPVGVKIHMVYVILPLFAFSMAKRRLITAEDHRKQNRHQKR
jgi:hypothetical protein